MFWGSYEHQVDQKGRMRLPSAFRNTVAGKTMIAVKGANHCIYIYEQEALEQDLSMYKKATFVNEDKNAERALRAISSSAFVITEDNQNRFTLSSMLRQFANIRKDIVFLGNGNKIELWDKENWENYMNGTDEDYDSLLLNLVNNKEGDEE